jgi:hypothetical protein
MTPDVERQPGSLRPRHGSMVRGIRFAAAADPAMSQTRSTSAMLTSSRLATGCPSYTQATQGSVTIVKKTALSTSIGGRTIATSLRPSSRPAAGSAKSNSLTYISE